MGVPAGETSSAADREVLVRTIIDCIPTWYVAETGPAEHAIPLAGRPYTFYSFSAHAPVHDALLLAINEHVDEWDHDMPHPPTRSYLAAVREQIALQWLRLHEPGIAWNRLLSYMDGLAYRTYENRPVVRNLIVRAVGRGTVLIDEPDLQMVLDPLAGSPQTYVAVDYQGRYLDYDEVLYGAIADTERYALHPEFLQPIRSQLRPGDYSLHLTERGDVIALGVEGLIAAHRRGRWYVYDGHRLQHDLSGGFGHYGLSANLFGLMLDLSYRGRGALLVYDPDRVVLQHLVNPEDAVIGGTHPRGDLARRLLAPAVGPIRVTEPGLSRHKKRLLLEIATLDGAVLFDDENVLAFGAMIKPNPKVGGHHGARTTAMHSAYLWGGKPIKISADGEIVIPFVSRGPQGACEAQLAFL